MKDQNNVVFFLNLIKSTIDIKRKRTDAFALQSRVVQKRMRKRKKLDQIKGGIKTMKHLNAALAQREIGLGMNHELIQIQEDLRTEEDLEIRGHISF